MAVNVLKSRFAIDIDQVPMQMQMEKISLRNNENKKILSLMEIQRPVWELI